MMWFLIFCVDYNTDARCNPPQAMPSRDACLIVGSNMADLSRNKNYTSYPESRGRFRCVGVKKP